MDLVDFDEDTFAADRRRLPRVRAAHGRRRRRRDPGLRAPRRQRRRALRVDGLVRRAAAAALPRGGRRRGRPRRARARALPGAVRRAARTTTPTTTTAATPGSVAGGTLRVGEDVVVLPSGARSRVARHRHVRRAARGGRARHVRDGPPGRRPRRLARAGRARAPWPRRVVRELVADVCWLDDRPAADRRALRAQARHARHPGRLSRGPSRVDVDTLERVTLRAALELNDIGRLRLRTAAPLALNPTPRTARPGAFILIDENTNATVARRDGRRARSRRGAAAAPRSANVVRQRGVTARADRWAGRSAARRHGVAHRPALVGQVDDRLASGGGCSSAAGRAAYVLDGDTLRHGLTGDLGFSAEARAENVRRAGEAAVLVADAGTLSIVSLVSPYAEDARPVRRRHADEGLPFLEIHVDTPVEECERARPQGPLREGPRGRDPRASRGRRPLRGAGRPGAALDGTARAGGAVGRARAGAGRAPTSCERAYLVCATQRSGSTLLCEALKATGVAGHPEEFFEARPAHRLPPRAARLPRGHRRPLRHRAARGRPAAAGAAVLRAGRRCDWEAHLARSLRDGRTPNGVFGAKVMWNQLADIAELSGRDDPLAAARPDALGLGPPPRRPAPGGLALARAADADLARGGRAAADGRLLARGDRAPHRAARRPGRGVGRLLRRSRAGAARARLRGLRARRARRRRPGARAPGPAGARRHRGRSAAAAPVRRHLRRVGRGVPSRHRRPAPQHTRTPCPRSERGRPTERHLPALARHRASRPALRPCRPDARDPAARRGGRALPARVRDGGHLLRQPRGARHRPVPARQRHDRPRPPRMGAQRQPAAPRAHAAPGGLLLRAHRRAARVRHPRRPGLRPLPRDRLQPRRDRRAAGRRRARGRAAGAVLPLRRLLRDAPPLLRAHVAPRRALRVAAGAPARPPRGPPRHGALPRQRAIAGRRRAAGPRGARAHRPRRAHARDPHDRPRAAVPGREGDALRPRPGREPHPAGPGRLPRRPGAGRDGLPPRPLPHALRPRRAPAPGVPAGLLAPAARRRRDRPPARRALRGDHLSRRLRAPARGADRPLQAHPPVRCLPRARPPEHRRRPVQGRARRIGLGRVGHRGGAPARRAPRPG